MPDLKQLPEPGPHSRRLRGILYILCAAFFFSLMSFFVKLSGDLPFWEKAFFRNFVAIFVSLYLLRRSGHNLRELPRSSLSALFLRCLFGTAGLFLNFYAIGKMHIGDANMLNKMAPFFSTLMSVFLLGEKPSRIDLLTLLVALLGAAFVVKPGSGIASLPALLALLGGFFAGTAYTFIRKLGTHGVYGPIIVFAFSLFSALSSIPMTLLHFAPMTAAQLLCLLLGGCAAAAAQLAVTAAYTYAPAREISVFDYTQVLFASLLGLLFLGERPDRCSLIGYLLIIGTAVAKWGYGMRKEKMRKQV